MMTMTGTGTATPPPNHDPGAQDDQVSLGLDRERRRTARVYVGAAILIVVLVAWGSLSYVQNQDTMKLAQDSKNAAQDNANSVNQLRGMVDQVCRPVQNNSDTKKRLQSQDPNAAQICEQAQKGQLPTAVGPQGSPGVGVVSTMYDITRLGCFRVVTTYSNGHQDTSSEICAPSGSPGATGSPGKQGSVGPYPPCFFTPTQCNGSNGTNGKDGVGIQKVDCVNNTALTIWLDGDDPNGPGRSLGDGTCGQGPKGDKGDKGDPGPQCPDGYTGTPVQQLDGSSIYECVSPAPQPTSSTPSPNPTPSSS